jgi:hypothetical protein
MSATLVGTVRGLFAVASVNNDGLSAAFSVERGFAGPAVRNGVGDVTLTLQDGLLLSADGGGTAQLTVFGSKPAASSVEQVDANTLRVRTEVAGVPADVSFCIELQDVGPT